MDKTVSEKINKTNGAQVKIGNLVVLMSQSRQKNNVGEEVQTLPYYDFLEEVRQNELPPR